MRPRCTTWTWLLVVLSLAFAIRAAAAFAWQARLPSSTAFALPDSTSYWELARTIAEGTPYQYGSHESRVFRTPGYPGILAVLFLSRSAAPPVLWARLLGALLGTVAVASAMLLARLLFDRRAAWLTGWLTAIYPGGIALSILVLSEAPFCPLMLVQLIFWVMAWNTPRLSSRNAWSALAGVVGGVATLMRPSWLLFTPFCLVVFLLRGERKKHLGIGCVMLAGLGLTMLPWWIRNYQVTGTPVLTTLQVGASLYDGLNPTATGASDMSFTQDFYWDLKNRGDADRGSFEVRLDRMQRTAAWEWVRREPGRVFDLAIVKFGRMWNIWPNSAETGSVWIRMLVTIGYLPLLVLSVLGTWKFVRFNNPAVLCLLPAVYLTALHTIFVSSIRYRQPAMLALIVLAAAALAEISRGGLRRGSREAEIE